MRAFDFLKGQLIALEVFLHQVIVSLSRRFKDFFTVLFSQCCNVLGNIAVLQRSARYHRHSQ